MNNNTLILVAAIAAVIVMSKKASAAPKPATTTGMPSTASGASPIASNLNNQLWSSLLGGAWNSMVGSSSGTTPFLMRNEFGQVTTSDGKPIDTGISDISDIMSGWGGTDYLSEMGW